MENKKRLLNFTIFFVAVGITGMYFFFSRQSPKNEATFYENLVSSNRDFALGESLYKSGKYESAISSYKTALQGVKEPDEKAQILYKISLAYRFDNQPLVAIPLFKEIVANPEYPLTTRAYSVQAMGQAYYSFNDQAITEEIFKDSPYKEMYSKDDTALSYRKLFEYASSFYPLGIPETRIAQWYAQEIVNSSKSGNTSNNESYKNIIRTKLANATTDIARTQTNPDRGSLYIPEILTRKASILGMLSLSGDESLGNPEEAFKKSMDTATGSAVYEAQARYFYALFLAKKYGAERSTEIWDILSNFYATTRYDNTGIVRFIKNEKNNQTGSKENIVMLANLDMKFKNYLIKLGWQF